MNTKLLLGVAVGFLICHFMYKRKYQLKDNEIDAKLKKVRNNIEEFLKQEDVLPKQIDVEKMADNIMNAHSMNNVEMANFSGTARKIL